MVVFKWFYLKKCATKIFSCILLKYLLSQKIFACSVVSSAAAAPVSRSPVIIRQAQSSVSKKRDTSGTKAIHNCDRCISSRAATTRLREISHCPSSCWKCLLDIFMTSAVARASRPSSTWRGTSTCTATSPGSRGSPYRYADILSCHWSIMWHIAIARILSSDWSVLANVTQSWLNVLEYYNLIGQNTKWWGYSNLIGQCSSDQDTVIWLVNVLEYCHLIGHLSMSRARPPPRPLPRSRTADSTNSSSLSTIKWASDLK